MRLLLDTHAFLWWNEGNARLSKKAITLLSDPANTLLLSVVSAWEVVLKVQAGKLTLPEPPAVYVPTRAAHYAIEILPMSLAHVLAASHLPLHHNDPFDRLLAAQAKSENVPIVTIDRELGRYPIKTIW